jgi:hypothetical protein
MIKLRNKLLLSNFIHCDLILNQGDKSIIGFDFVNSYQNLLKCEHDLNEYFAQKPSRIDSTICVEKLVISLFKTKTFLPILTK